LVIAFPPRQVTIHAESSARTDDLKVTFTHDIAPIIFHNCAGCHHPGGAGPFPLLTYEDVKSHARQIATVTGSRFMPPWQPEPGELKFDGERRLSDAQITVIQQWVEEGAVEGQPGELPPVPHFAEEGWQLGTPDLVPRTQKPFLLPAAGGDTYWNFVLPIPVDGTRWVKAVEIRPGEKRLVHHANMLVDRLGRARELEKEPGSGFGGMEIRLESEAFDPDSHLLFWKPGSVPAEEPEGMALRIDKGTNLVLNMHLQPSGKPEVIQPSVGLYFTDKPATLHPMLLEIENDAALHVPAGAKEFAVADEFILPVEVDVLAIYPHAHYLGKDILAYARLPNGSVKTLIHIPHWDLNWQAVYRYAELVRLPKGTVLGMRYTYDNSEANLRNPNHPPQLVKGGNRSSDEMAHLWLQVLPRSDTPPDVDPRRLLQEALSRHEVEKDPGNFEAQYNLAAMLGARGETKEAVAHYIAAAEIRPKDPVVANALGSVLLANGDVRGAIRSFQAALQERPNYFDARYNLGIALASQGDFPAAAQEFQESVRLNPEDANAHANLGAALAQLGKLMEAKSQLEIAPKLRPDSQLARDNLAEVEQMIARQGKSN